MILSLKFIKNHLTLCPLESNTKQNDNLKTKTLEYQFNIQNRYSNALLSARQTFNIYLSINYEKFLGPTLMINNSVHGCPVLLVLLPSNS